MNNVHICVSISDIIATYFDSTLAQDCSQDSECDINASCVDTGLKKKLSNGKNWRVTRCACKPGFVGNGITCANAQTGRLKNKVLTKTLVMKRNSI